jgi:excisionase family DNA binding protein
VTAKAAPIRVADRDLIECPGSDPREFLKLIAFGVFAGGVHVLQQVTGAATPVPSPMATTPVVDVMTADEVADWLRLDRKTVYDYAGRGVIPHQRIGKRMLFSRVALVQWLGSCSKGSSERGSG